MNKKQDNQILIVKNTVWLILKITLTTLHTVYTKRWLGSLYIDEIMRWLLIVEF